MKRSVSRREFIATSVAVAGAGAVALTSAPALAATAPLSAAEIKDLTFMREEEKVARDVYITLYNMWKHNTFNSISSSEQQHMDTIKKKLTAYKVPDPAQSAVGAFTDSGLQNMYNNLVATGSKSLIDALKVGCTIEEVDMIDLQHAIDDATHTDLDTIYASLMEGSKNHLRAFVSALAAKGVTYQPQYISVDLYKAIINT